MNFIPLYFQDKLTIVNPAGTIGVLTLWSKVDYVMERFRQAGVNLDPGSSPISAAPSMAQTYDIKLLGKERFKIRGQQYAGDTPAFELAGEPIVITGRKV